jgi:hypothetical protein
VSVDTESPLLIQFIESKNLISIGVETPAGWLPMVFSGCHPYGEGVDIDRKYTARIQK